MTAIVIIGVGLAIALAVPRIAVPAKAAANRRKRERDDTFFFQECMTSSPRWNRINRAIPAPPRCRICAAPFGGLGVVLGVRPSRLNRNYCDSCFERAPVGGHEMEIGVLVARVSIPGIVASDRDPTEAAAFAGRFRRRAGEVLAGCDAILDVDGRDGVGVGIVGLFLPVMATLGDRTCEVMVEAARRITKDEEGDATAPVTVGLDFGPALVGNVGSSDVKQFTAVGEAVDGAVRRQLAAEPGQIVISERVRSQLPGPHATVGLRIA